ncbi:unnamed protein product [Phyllotreta striolata]|uniref:Letm1 RBD domain-containing protein n=1 Tax=Phyllotreta striolata TaxID=444603 RepID=A0A9N9XRC6_PHYSR|nr:unnamed protein product [Phyllotreta striolata]
MNIRKITRIMKPGVRDPRISGIFQSSSKNFLNSSLSGSARLNHNKPNERKLSKNTPLYKTKEAKKVRYYIVEKYVEYLKKLETILEKRFPGAMKVYKHFLEGVRLFVTDTKEFFRIVRLLNTPGKSFQDLSRQEMELYIQMPRDMKKVAPILLLTALPFGTAILPLTHMFPRHLLCSHFWTAQQKSEFQLFNLKHRLTHNRPLFRHLQSQLDFLRNQRLYEQWREVIAMIGSGQQPPVKKILECRDLFTSEPYHLLYISRNHVIHLCKLHEMTTGVFFRRVRLAERAYIIKEMDRAIAREGGVEKLPLDALRKCCYIRGLNPADVQTEEMIRYLNNWLELSSNINRHCYSLLLHAPVLLAYNSPSNWRLIYQEKTN